MWERHYRCLVGTLPHTDVVSAVAFNPVDQEMAVTVSDDHTVKVWRSRNQARRLRRLQQSIDAREGTRDQPCGCDSFSAGATASNGQAIHSTTCSLVTRKAASQALVSTESSESDLFSD